MMERGTGAFLNNTDAGQTTMTERIQQHSSLKMDGWTATDAGTTRD